MRRREFQQALLFGGAGALGQNQAAAAGDKPNIVYILADDLGWGDLECYNRDSQIPTPNANRLAAEGVRFTDMHSPSSVCTPTRYGILTGRYCWRSRLKSGVLDGRGANLIEKGRLTVASLLRAQGYHTAAVGKWHLGFQETQPVDYAKPLTPGPNDHGFDYFFGIPASLDFEPYLFVENNRAVEPLTARTPGRNDPRGVFWRGGDIAPSFTMEGCLPTLEAKANGYIRERARSKQPFFLYFPLTGPHTPWMPTPEWQGKSKAGIYGDFVAQVDGLLGGIMKTLEETGQTRNTLLIFTSDNGAHWTPEDKKKFPHRSNANWRGQKADIHDAGHRIPFLARWPGRIKPGAVSGQLGCLTDLVATVADLTGASLPAGAGEDSFSWLPAALGTRPRLTPLREAVVHHSSQGMFAIRRGDWKLCEGRGSGGFTAPVKIEPKPGEPEGELYNLARDAEETENLYLGEPARVAELRGLLNRYRESGRSRPA